MATMALLALALVFTGFTTANGFWENLDISSITATNLESQAHNHPRPPGLNRFKYIYPLV